MNSSRARGPEPGVATNHPSLLSRRFYNRQVPKHIQQQRIPIACATYPPSIPSSINLPNAGFGSPHSLSRTQILLEQKARKVVRVQRRYFWVITQAAEAKCQFAWLCATTCAYHARPICPVCKTIVSSRFPWNDKYADWPSCCSNIA
jgi:hypothetical protein